MIYYELHADFSGRFLIDFGDYDKKVVQQEIEDRIGSELRDDDSFMKRSHYKIVEKEES